MGCLFPINDNLSVRERAAQDSGIEILDIRGHCDFHQKLACISADPCGKQSMPEAVCERTGVSYLLLHFRLDI